LTFRLVFRIIRVSDRAPVAYGPGAIFMGITLCLENASLTMEGQIEILKSRGLIISDHQKAIEILSFENYYRLINGSGNPPRIEDCNIM